VHKTAEIVPLVNAADAHAIAEADRNALGHVEVVCNQERLAARETQDEALVTGIVPVIGEQSRDDTDVFDPAPVVPLCIVPRDTGLTRP